MALALAAVFLVPAGASSETPDSKILLRAKSEAEALWRKGYLLGDVKLDADLQVLLDSLAAGRPVDPAIRLRAHVFRSPEVNAFALPDGSIYIFVGLLAGLTSRDQLAFILGHEAQHAIDLHGQRNLEQAKSKANVLGVLSMATSVALGASGIAGAGLIDAFAQLGLSLVASASINGYGRDLEKNADLAGLEMVQQVGLPGCSGVESMRALLEDSEESGRVSNFFWGSHPRLSDRIRYIQETVGDTCAPDTSRVDPDFEELRWAMTKKSAELWLTAEEPRAGLRPALRYMRRFPNDPEIHCLLGDLYLAVGGADTLAAAALEFETAQALGGDAFRPPLRGLALVAEARGDTAACVSWLEKYLDGDAPVPQRRALNRKLHDLRQILEARAAAPAESSATRPVR